MHSRALPLAAELEPLCEDATPADADDDEPELLGDESTFLGGAGFQRLPDQWTVWLVEVDFRATPELTAACRTLDEAWAVAERWRDDSENSDWAAIIVGPGEGPVVVENITLWPASWTVRSVDGGGGVGLDGCPDESSRIRAVAEARGDVCLVITAAYRPN